MLLLNQMLLEDQPRPFSSDHFCRMSKREDEAETKAHSSGG